MADALSNNSKLIAIPNQTNDVHMFTCSHYNMNGYKKFMSLC